jgi:hypothetical protein
MTTPNTQADVAGTAANASATAAAPKTQSKMGQCEAIFLSMTEKGHTNTRQSILAAFATQAQMTEHGANTYYASLCTKYKSQERKGVRAVREPKAAGTVTSKPGSSTVVAGTATGKKAGGKKTAVAAGATDAPFSVAHTDAAGLVTKVEPYFSQIIASQAQATAQASGITAHVVTGMAAVGQPITMFSAAQIAGQ